MIVRNNVSRWREIRDEMRFFRSLAEWRYACYLEWQRQHGIISDWLHEPQRFYFEAIKTGTRCYVPDFKIIDPRTSEGHWWAEVKGYLDAKSKTKIARFRKYYPKENLIVIDSKWFARNNKKLKGLVPGWE